MFSLCWLMLQLGVSLLHGWDLVDPKCSLCLCQVQWPGGYFSHFHLQQSKKHKPPVCVWPKNASLGRRGIISRHNLSHFSTGGFDIHSWLSGDAEPSLRALVSPTAEQGLLSRAQFGLVAAITKHCSSFLSRFFKLPFSGQRGF